MRLVEDTEVGWDGLQIDHAERLASAAQVGKSNSRSNGDKNSALQRKIGLAAPRVAAGGAQDAVGTAACIVDAMLWTTPGAVSRL